MVEGFFAILPDNLEVIICRRLNDWMFLNILQSVPSYQFEFLE